MPGSTVTLTIGTAVVGTGTADASGNFSVAPTSGLVQGSNTISVTSTSGGGTSTASTVTFNYDTAAPAAAAVTGVSDNVGSVQGPLSGGGTTDDTTLTLTGTAEAGATVTVYNGTTVLGTTTATSAGWTFTTSALPGGSASLTARATDAAGNQGAASTAFTTTIDTTAPAAPTSVTLASDTGSSATDKITSDGTIKGVAEANSTVTLKIGTTVVGTGTADASGNFSIAPTSGLVQGSNTVAVTSTDRAGNTGAATNLTFTLDSAAPAAASFTATGAGITGGSGALNAGDTVVFTLNASEALTVTGTPTLTLSNGATATYTGGTGNNALTFSYTVAAADGNVGDLAVSALNTSNGATVRDAAGNAVTFNSATAGNPTGTLRIDTAAPSAPASVALASDTGQVGDGITSNPTIKGTAEAGSTVTLKVGAATVGTGTADAQGNFSIAPTGLAQGANTVTVSATDTAGNTGTATSLSFTLDNAAPAAVSVAASGAGIVDGNGALNAGKVVTLTVTASEAMTVTGTPTLSLSSGGTATYVGGSGTAALAFTYTVGAGENADDLSVATLNLPNGASITDAAGNAVAAGGVTAVNPAGTLSVDTVAPDVATTVGLSSDTGASPTDGVTSNAALSGRVSNGQAGVTVAVFDNGAEIGRATTGENGDWTFANAGAANGSHAYTARVSDAAGNLGPTAATSPASVTVDKAAPTEATTIALVSDTGAAGDGATANAALNGTGPAGATVVVKDGSTIVATLVADGTGAWTFANTAAAAGSHSYTAQVADAAGNLGPASATLAVNLDRSGNDNLGFLATAGADSTAGDDGSDTITGLGGDDTLWGDDAAGVAAGEGADSINAGAGNDLLLGGAGNDTLVGGAGNDTLDGGAGSDTANYQSAAGGLTFTYDSASGAFTASDGSGGTDTLRNVETILASFGNDSLDVSCTRFPWTPICRGETGTMKPSMNENDRLDAVDVPVVSAGGRGPSPLSTGRAAPMAPAAPKPSPLAPGQRWSVGRKREVVLRLMRGESAELLSRELVPPIFKSEQWRRKAEAALEGALEEREADPATGELAAAMQRIGEPGMENEPLRTRIARPGPLARGRSR